MLPVISKDLSYEKQVRLFNERDVNGSTVLIIATVFQPQRIPALIEYIGSLKPQDRRNILIQKNTFKVTPLLGILHSSRNLSTQAFFSLMKAIDRLKEEDKFYCLAQTMGSTNMSALLLSAAFHPVLLPSLLQVIGGLNATNQSLILRQTDYFANNFLMIALHMQSVVSAKLNEGLKGLQISDVAYLFRQVNCQNNNALLLALIHIPSYLPELLNVVSCLEIADRFIIFQQINDEAHNLLTLAAIFQPQVLGHLFKAYDCLSIQQQFCLYQMTQSLLRGKGSRCRALSEKIKQLEEQWPSLPTKINTKISQPTFFTVAKDESFKKDRDSPAPPSNQRA